MALTIADTLVTPVNGQTINSGATYTSAETDVGANALVESPIMFVDVTGFASAVGGNARLVVSVLPVHTTSGTAYGSAPMPMTYNLPCTDAAYSWTVALPLLPRFYKVTVLNDTNQNTDVSAVTVRIAYRKVTV